jgi:CRP-like cAMP-binding protein
MLTTVERVLILKQADLLKNVGPRHLLSLAAAVREIAIAKGETIYREDDPADSLYMVVEGRVRLSAGDRITSEVGAGEAFGTWALVDDSSRGQSAQCVEDGLVLALDREDFYDLAATDVTLLREIIRVLAKRLRALAAEKPEETRIEGEGVAPPAEEPAGGDATAGLAAKRPDKPTGE